MKFTMTSNIKLLSVLTVFAVLLASSAAFAANGDGAIISYSPDATTVGTQTDVYVEFTNDGTACLDELIITPPSTWTGAASVVDWSRGPITFTNFADDGTGNGLVANPQSVRILPTGAPGPTKILCAGETVTFKIQGLVAPASPEVSTFETWTSDVNSVLRQMIDAPFIVIHVTDAEGLKIEYVQIHNVGVGGVAEIKFDGTGKGGWGQITELYVTRAGGAATADVYMDKNNNGNLDIGTDFLLASGAGLTGGGTPDTIPLTYDNTMDVGAVVQDGFIKGDSSVKFFIDIAGGGTANIIGHADVALDPDPTVIGTGFEGISEGTVINVDSPGVKRLIKVQLVREILIDGTPKAIDVKDADVPIHFTTDLSSFVESDPEGTDLSGEVEIHLNPGTTKGVADTEILQLGLTPTNVAVFNEQGVPVGINSGAPASWEVTEGEGASVPAGSYQLVEATVYDQFGNIITDVPATPTVNFDLLSPVDGSASLDDDTIPGAPSFFETEPTSQGIGDTFLLTAPTIGDHTVQVCVPGINNQDTGTECKTITVHGILGAPAKVVIEAPAETSADQCIVATVKITDANGNVIDVYNDPITGHPQQWSSLVRVELSDPLTTYHPSPLTGEFGTTTITGSDFLEEEIGYNGQYVQGKVQNGVGEVTICGCQGLGTFDIEGFSDTLESDEIFVNVENAPPSCINLDLVENQYEDLLACQPDTQLDVGVLDTCGNYIINQQCGQGGGAAQTCVELTASDSGSLVDLSTDVVCVDLSETGHAPLVDITRLSDECGAVEFGVLPQQQCCVSDFPTDLPVCEPVDLTLIGKPVRITSEFETKRDNTPIPNGGSDFVSEKIRDNFYALDACNNVVRDFNGEIDVELKGEDCVSFIEVDSPADLDAGRQTYCSGTPYCEDLTPQGQDVCQISGCTWDAEANEGEGACGGEANSNACAAVPYTFEQCWELINGGYQQEGENGCQFINECQLPEDPVFKLVVDNCAEPGKQWTDLEEEDIMVDKLAFTVSAPDYSGLELWIYRESEETAGFQIGEDDLVAKAPVHNVNSWPNGLTVAELEATAPYFGPDWFTRGTEEIGTAGDEREGGVLVRAGDTTDFYVVLHKDEGSPLCGVYDVNFAFYQDYNSPDVTDFDFSGHVEDYAVDNDDHNYVYDGDDSRNNNYNNYQGYGFGDRMINNLDFEDGYAWMTFRDLTAEDVDVISSDVFLSGAYCDYQEEAEVGRCYVANDCHGPLDYKVTKEDCQDVRGESWRGPDGVCEDLPAEDESLIDVAPNPEEITFQSQLATQVVLINHDGFEPKDASCTEIDADENTFLLNIQTADGFQNPHAKELEVRMEWCLQWPTPVLPDENGELPSPEQLPDFLRHALYDDQDVDRCFNKQDLRQLISEEFDGYIDPVLFGDYFGDEFQAFLESIFQDDTVVFRDAVTNQPLPVLLDDEGNEYTPVFTDENGQAQVRVSSDSTGLFKIIANPLALDQDYTFVNFKAGVPIKLDAIAFPAFGVPADGEEEAFVLLRALDSCGNPVNDFIEDATVEIRSESGQATISRDFTCENNYDQDVTGDFESNLLGIYGSPFGGYHADTCLLQVMDDIPELATITASSPALDGDSTEVLFQGAPVKLKIVNIMPSDRLPADGKIYEEYQTGTGAWVDIEVQDKNSNRVTGYLGKGFAGDPDDKKGLTDFKFENVCVKFTDPNAFIPEGFIDSTTFGWINFHFVGFNDDVGGREYCGDLLFGKGSVYVAYENTDNNHGGSFDVIVFDRPQYQCQEINENGLPDSELTTQCQKDEGQLDFVDPATKWNAAVNRIVVPADGVSKAMITVKVENDFMAIRQAVEGTVQSDLDGSVLSWWSPDGALSDPLNPASAVFLTDWKSGLATLDITSTEPGKARITITGGDAYICRDIDHPGIDHDIEGLNPNLLDPLAEEDYEHCKYSSHKDLQPVVVEVEFLEVASNELSLQTGWNFISTPHRLAASNNEIGEIMSGSACYMGGFAWDANTQSFVALTPTTVVQPLEGYWISMDCPEVIPYDYLPAQATTPPQKNVVPGWNTVGLTLDNPLQVELGLISVDSSYTTLIDWIESQQDYGLPVANTGVQCDDGIPTGTLPFTTCGSNMLPKQGYWIWVTQPSVLSGFDV